MIIKTKTYKRLIHLQQLPFVYAVISFNIFDNPGLDDPLFFLFTKLCMISSKITAMFMSNFADDTNYGIYLKF